MDCLLQSGHENISIINTNDTARKTHTNHVGHVMSGSGLPYRAEESKLSFTLRGGKLLNDRLGGVMLE